MRHIFLLSLLSALLLQISTQEDQSDCQAGQYFDGSKCKSCEKSRTIYSGDGAAKCSDCPDSLDHCFCDTRSPHLYVPENENEDLKKKCVEVDGYMQCTKGCYDQARHALSGKAEGRIFDNVTVLNCSCENNRTKESCLKRKNFTNTCFRNECDGHKFYDTTTLNITLSECRAQYRDKKTCSKAKCVEELSPYRLNLSTCNCYHAKIEDKANCEDLQDFYKNLEENCTDGPLLKPETILSIVIPTVFVLIILFLLLAMYSASKYGRYLKRSGDIGRLNRFVVWGRVKPLGAAAKVLTEGGADRADTLHTREILLKVQFRIVGGRFAEWLFRPQHVVLKIFSEFQSEQQSVELGIINSISDKKKAKEHNIISVYGPGMNADNRDLVIFLDTLLKKSKTFERLKEVIERNYLGRSGDVQEIVESPRCKYIMMNHCNEYSLSKFIRTRPRLITLDMIICICKDLAMSLQYIHEMNNPVIVHCDIKPDNIFVKRRSKKTSFILGDFGFAERHEGRPFTIKGSTPSFVPPEWYLGYCGRDDDRSDLHQRICETRANDPCKIDIYAYGLIVWLALHKATEPWTDRYSDDWRQCHSQNRSITREGFLKNLFSNPESDKFDTRPICRDDEGNTNSQFLSLLRLAHDCWQKDFSKRPSATQILEGEIFQPRNTNTHSNRSLVYRDFVPHHHVNGDVDPPVEVV